MTDFPFDVITADEYDRQLALHEPLTRAVRDLIDAGIRTDLDEAGVREAQAAIEAVTARVRNAIAPPMDIHHEDGGRCWAEFDLGEVASDGLTKPLFTGTIALRYLRGTPLGPVRAEAFVERSEGIKTYARGHLGNADGWSVEAEGVFIRPAWAREA